MSREDLLKIQRRLEKLAKVRHDFVPQAYGYIRTSKSEREHKYSSDYQERLIKEYFDRMSKIEGTTLFGVSWGAIYLDRESGKTPFSDRTAGRVLVNRLLPGDFLICYNLDRMSRSMWDSANLFDFFMQCNIRLMTTDGEVDLSTATGQMMAMIKIGFAQIERERIVERTKRGLEQRRLVKRKWMPNVQAPIGWRRQKVHGEWRHVKWNAARLTAMKIVVWKEQEKMNWTDIGTRLRRRGIKHGKTQVWYIQVVQDYYFAAKAGFPNNHKYQRENLPPLTIEVPDDSLAAASQIAT